MKKQGIWAIVSVLVALGLILASCAQAPAAPTTPTAPAAPAAPAAVAPVPPKLIKWVLQAGAEAPPIARFPAMMPVAVQRFMKNIMEERFPGRFELSIVPTGSVVPEAEVMKAVSKNVIQLGSGFGGFYIGEWPLGNVSQGLPFAWQTAAEVYDGMLNFGLHDYLQEDLAKRGIYYLVGGMGSVQGLGGYVGMNTDPSYYKGKKLRAVGVWQKWVQKLGGTAVVVTYADMYMALKLGTIQGVILSVPFLDTVKGKEVLDSWVMYPNSSDYGSGFMVSLEALNALPDDIKSFVKNELFWAIAYFGLVRTNQENYWRAAQAEIDGYIKRINYSEEDASYVRDVGFAIWDEIAAISPEVARAVGLVRNQMKVMGKMK